MADKSLLWLDWFLLSELRLYALSPTRDSPQENNPPSCCPTSSKPFIQLLKSICPMAALQDSLDASLVKLVGTTGAQSGCGKHAQRFSWTPDHLELSLSRSDLKTRLPWPVVAMSTLGAGPRHQAYSFDPRLTLVLRTATALKGRSGSH